MMIFCFLIDLLEEILFLFQQLELITPFQLYFNPELIFKHFQVSGPSQPPLMPQFLNLVFLHFSS